MRKGRVPLKSVRKLWRTTFVRGEAASTFVRWSTSTGHTLFWLPTSVVDCKSSCKHVRTSFGSAVTTSHSTMLAGSQRLQARGHDFHHQTQHQARGHALHQQNQQQQEQHHHHYCHQHQHRRRQLWPTTVTTLGSTVPLRRATVHRSLSSAAAAVVVVHSVTQG